MQDWLSLLEAAPALRITGLIVFGLIVGSFLNVVIHRLPVILEKQWQRQCEEYHHGPAPDTDRPVYNLATPRSHCPHCQRPIRAWENLPLISFLLLRGRCPGCHAAISWRYPLVELLGATVAVAAMEHFGLNAAGLAAMIFGFSLLALTFIDLDNHLLPDNITLPLLWLGLLVNSAGLFTDLQSAVIGAVAGYLILWTVYQSFKLLSGKEGMGFGDFKLLAACGAWSGWQMLPLTILLSSLVGAIIGVVMIALAKHHRQQPIPFGPYLAAAGWVALLWGDALVEGYLKIIGW